ncbi:MAG TPA: DASS family sodium-coupled anion symporter [Bacillales bacterium]|nr:DASS family sodium-coupled anion symporter [Bacillales bacterium]
MSDIARQTKKNKETINIGKAVFYQKSLFGIFGSMAVFAAVLFCLPESFHGAPAKMLAIVAGAVMLWITEAISIELTAVMTLVAMLLLQPVPTDVVYSGFSSSAIFLIIGGMMMARAVNETRLAKRITYFILARWGGNAKGLLASILIIPQVQAFFIPAVAVRTTLLLPITMNVLDTIGAKQNSRLRKLILLGVAFGSTVSGTAVMTAAISNILTVEMLEDFAHIEISYFQWFLYALPLWLIMIPGIWIVLLKCFPLEKREQSFPQVKAEIQQRLKAFGSLDASEIKCLIVLGLIVSLWMTEPLHGLDPSIPALIGLTLMTLPGIGCAKWSNAVKINFNTILILGTTLSMGYAFNASGAAHKIGEVLAGNDWVLTVMHNPVAAVIVVIIATQLIHLIMSNVSTAVVTLIPVYLGLAATAGVDPLYLCFAAALTCLHGYILVVESMPNIMIHGTGQISQRAFFIPGLFATLLMMAVTVVIALTWWKWLGLVSF